MKTLIKKIQTGLITIGCFTLFTSLSCAQQDDNVYLLFPIDNPASTQDKDIRLGSFIFHPDITFTQYYDDNIFSTTLADADNITAFNTELEFISDWKQHLLDLKFGINASKYSTYKSENTVDKWINIKTQYDTSQSSYLQLTASHIDDHEDRSSPETIFGNEPLGYLENQLTFRAEKSFNQHSLTIAATLINLDYQDVNTSSGILSNDTRDRVDDSTGFRFNYAVYKGNYIFIRSSLENRDYDQVLDLNLINRDSRIKSNAIGYKFKYRKKLYGELFAGLLKQEFDSSQFEPIKENNYGVNIKWQTSDSSKIVITADRSIEETTLNDSPGIIYDQYSLVYRHGLNLHWSYYLNTTSAIADYQVITRQDKYNDYSIGAYYLLEQGLSFGLDYVYMKRDSTEDLDDYSRNQVFLRVSARM